MFASHAGGDLMSALPSGAAGITDLFSAHEAVTRPPAPDSSPRARKLYQECQQFEGLLIANLWGEMNEGTGMADLGPDPGAATMQGLGIQEAAGGIARAGGLGIARMLYDALSRRAPA